MPSSCGRLCEGAAKPTLQQQLGHGVIPIPGRLPQPFRQQPPPPAGWLLLPIPAPCVQGGVSLIDAVHRQQIGEAVSPGSAARAIPYHYRLDKSLLVPMEELLKAVLGRKHMGFNDLAAWGIGAHQSALAAARIQAGQGSFKAGRWGCVGCHGIQRKSTAMGSGVSALARATASSVAEVPSGRWLRAKPRRLNSAPSICKPSTKVP